MIDFTPLVQAIITLAAAAVTIFLIPWLKARYGNEALDKARSWVQIAVYAAEKMYGAGHGDEKLAYAEQVLEQHKIKLDFNTLKAMVDAEIKKMEQSQGVSVVQPLKSQDDVEEEIGPEDGGQ